LDIAKLGWWEGGRFYAQAHWMWNLRGHAFFARATGAFNPVSSIDAGDHIRVYNLFYRHSWREDGLVLKVGQIAVDDDFMGSDYAGLFVNSAFGPMPSQVGTPLATVHGNTPPFPIYSVAGPGLFFAAKPGKAFYTQLGVYYGRVGLDEGNNYGFDWTEDLRPEVGLFWENGLSFKVRKRSATTRIGLSYHSGPIDDFTGRPAEVPPVTQQNAPNFYLIQDLELLSGADGATKLGVFARGGLTPEPEHSMVACYVDGGLNWFGPIPGRGADVAGLAVSHTAFGAEYRRSLLGEGIGTGETTLEFTYLAPITRWMSLQADAQLLFNPAAKPDNGKRETAVLLGLRAQVIF
jgi:porin